MIFSRLVSATITSLVVVLSVTILGCGSQNGIKNPGDPLASIPVVEKKSWKDRPAALVEQEHTFKWGRRVVPGSKSIAVLIGQSEYKPGSGGFRNLPLVNKDIEKMGRTLREAGFDDVITFTRSDELTREQLRTFFDGYLPGLVNEKTQLLIYWSGHGAQRETSVGPKGYFVLPESINGQFDTMLSMDEFHNWISPISAKQILYVIDTCYSGLFAAKSTASNQRAVQTERNIGGKMLGVYSSSSSDQEASMKNGWNGSAFTEYLTRGISKSVKPIKNNIIGMNEIIAGVGNSMQEERIRDSRIEIPSFRRLVGDEGGEYFFTRPASLESNITYVAIDDKEYDALSGVRVMILYNDKRSQFARSVYEYLNRLGAVGCGFEHSPISPKKYNPNVVYHEGDSARHFDAAHVIFKLFSAQGVTGVGVYNGETYFGFPAGVGKGCDIRLHIN